MLQTGVDELPTNQAMPHNENTTAFEVTFINGKNAFIEVLLEVGNRLQENGTRINNHIGKISLKIYKIAYFYYV